MEMVMPDHSSGGRYSPLSPKEVDAVLDTPLPPDKFIGWVRSRTGARLGRSDGAPDCVTLYLGDARTVIRGHGGQKPLPRDLKLKHLVNLGLTT